MRRQIIALDSQSALMTANQFCFVFYDRFSCAQRLQRVLLQPIPAGIGCRQGHMGRHHWPLALSLTPCCHLLGKNLQGQDQIQCCRQVEGKWKDKPHVSLHLSNTVSSSGHCPKVLLDTINTVVNPCTSAVTDVSTVARENFLHFFC